MAKSLPGFERAFERVERWLMREAGRVGLCMK